MSISQLLIEEAFVVISDTILEGIVIGEFFILGAGLVVTRDADPYTIVAENLLM